MACPDQPRRYQAEFRSPHLMPPTTQSLDGADSSESNRDRMIHTDENPRVVHRIASPAFLRVCRRASRRALVIPARPPSFVAVVPCDVALHSLGLQITPPTWAPTPNFDAGTALENLCAEVVDIEALACAAKAAPRCVRKDDGKHRRVPAVRRCRHALRCLPLRVHHAHRGAAAPRRQSEGFVRRAGRSPAGAGHDDRGRPPALRWTRSR